MTRSSVKAIDNQILQLRAKARLILKELDKLADNLDAESFETIRVMQMQWVNIMIEIMSLRALKWHLKNNLPLN